MKNYIYLVGALCLTACAKENKPTSYICFNPFMPIQSFQFSTDHPQVKDLGDRIQATTDDGNVFFVPKGLCVEVRTK